MTSNQPPTTWHERTLQVLRELEWSRAELARQSGISKESIYKYLAGSIHKPRGDNLRAISQALGVSEVWLTFGTGEKQVRQAAAPPREDISPRDAAGQSVLLSVEEMYRADALATEAGIAGLELMEAAGAAIAREIIQRWRKMPALILCGPGNNGGDGFVVARLLEAEGWPVRLVLLGNKENLKGDAATNARRWKGAVDGLGEGLFRHAPQGGELVVDALFGAGLTRPLEGAAAWAVEELERRGLPVVAVDVPSGIDGDSGHILGGEGGGVAVRAQLTVTFFRRKPGHLLLPGRSLCGEVVVADIGTPVPVLDDIAPQQYENGPALWHEMYLVPGVEDHKYSRGHAVVMGGAQMTGAARLAARACLRAGAGLVSIACDSEVWPVYAATTPGVLAVPLAGLDSLSGLLADERKNLYLLGPGNGISGETRARVLAVLGAGRACVLDADALGVFTDSPEVLFDSIRSPCVLTPHEGEFRRLFGDGDGTREGEEGKLARARSAARRSGAVVLLKGADTVIADPQGNAVINGNAPPTLATAGSGDVLAGFIAGLMAQGMPPFAAACAGAWIHGAAGASFGPGLIAEDLPDLLPTVLRDLFAETPV